jgi:hypothetical protein
MTFLADTRLASRLLIGLSYLLAALMLGMVIGVEAFWLTLIAYGLFQIAFEPILPLQDGLNFTVQAVAAVKGSALSPSTASASGARWATSCPACSSGRCCAKAAATTGSS